MPRAAGIIRIAIINSLKNFKEIQGKMVALSSLSSSSSSSCLFEKCLSPLLTF